MISMMIVDDSHIELDSLKNLINWNELGIEVTNTATNGMQALEIIKKNPPNILLTDIRMPIMDGIELARLAKEVSNSTLIIFLSAYDDFSYAKKGIELNVSSYIMKPIRISDLIQEVKKVVETYNNQMKQLLDNEQMKKQLEESMPLLRERLLSGILHGEYKDNAILQKRIDYLGSRIMKTGFYIVLLIILDGFDSQTEQNYRDLVSIYILNKFNNSKNSSFSSTAVQHRENQFAVILQFDKNKNKMELYNTIESYITNLKKEICEATDARLVIFAGNIAENLVDIHTSFKAAQELLEYNLSVSEEALMFYSDVGNIAEESDEVSINHNFIANIEDRLSRSIITGNQDEISTLVVDLFNHLNKCTKVSNSYIQNICIYIISLGMKVVYEMGIDPNNIVEGQNFIKKLINFHSIVNIHQWMINVLSTFSLCVKEKRQSKNQAVVNQILMFIEKHYPEDISLVSISKEIYLTPNYIGYIFKSALGETFNDYLIKFRLEKAKIMLSDIHKKIYEVSAAVGYSNVAYFCTKFKNMYGISPSDFRDLILKEHVDEKSY